MAKHICKAKRQDNNEWVQGYLFYDDYDRMYRIITGVQYSTGTFADVISHRVLPDTICKCTPMQDKNKKWIFENDIVKDQYERSETVSWGSYSIYPFVAFPEYKSWNNDDCEVIGNKFDDINLMEM